MNTDSSSISDSKSHTPTILIVDDTPVNLKVAINALRDQGYKTPVATTGDRALERAQTLQPDLILLDVMLPEMDGFEICRRLKTDDATKHIPIIFMTMLDAIGYKLKGFQEGGVDYVTKPVQVEELLARVVTHLRLRALTRNLQQQAIELASANAEIRALNERLKAENIQVTADLKMSEQKYATLTEEMREGYFLLQDDRIVFANQAFCDMHGCRADEAAGQALAHFVASESRTEVQKFYAQSRRNMQLAHLFEYQRLTKNGRALSTEMTVKTVEYDGQPVDIGLCRDNTERHDMEQRMLEAERLACIGRVTTSLSHELHNPLSAIKMTLEILTTKRQASEKDWYRIDLAYQETARLEGILKGILDFAKPVTLQKRAVNLHRTASAAVELLRVKFDQKHVAVRVACAQNVPDIQADPEKLSQVFLNLLLNALESSTAEGEVRITIRGPDHPVGVEILIEDDGEGIPEDQLIIIFDPFFTTKPQGTGLGLSNVKQIVEAHGGRVEAHNRHPRGACFCVWLPEDF